MGSNSEDIILLTGAGFSKNFGGFLGAEMWVMVFNNPLIQAQERIRSLLLRDFDFESVYSEVISNNDYTADEKEAIKEAIEQVYQRLNNVLESTARTHEVDLDKLRDFLVSLLFNDDSENGLFFTLNQDLFIEGFFGRHIYMPGINPNSNGTNLALPQKYCMNMLKCEIDNCGKKAIYVKLHGSCNWLSSHGGDAMVIGGNKLEYIEQEPLLKCYLQLLQDKIKEGNKKLLIIGYGFRDEHINKILLDGVRNDCLRLYIINPLDPSSFRDYLFKKVPCAEYLWSALRGYFPYTFDKIFPNIDVAEQIHMQILGTLMA